MQPAEALADYFPSFTGAPCSNAYNEPSQISVPSPNNFLTQPSYLPCITGSPSTRPVSSSLSVPHCILGLAAPHQTVLSQNSITPRFFYHHTSPAPMQTKKPSLPKFSGERSAWPELKALWKALAEPKFCSPLQLAKELKEACKGKAADRIKNLYQTSDGAYMEMWRRLEAEYDDPGLAVQAALKRLRGLKPVTEKDYTGLV